MDSPRYSRSVHTGSRNHLASYRVLCRRAQQLRWRVACAIDYLDCPWLTRPRSVRIELTAVANICLIPIPVVVRAFSPQCRGSEGTICIPVQCRCVDVNGYNVSQWKMRQLQRAIRRVQRFPDCSRSTHAPAAFLAISRPAAPQVPRKVFGVFLLLRIVLEVLLD